MKGLAALIRVRKFELEEKRRHLAELEEAAARLETAIVRLAEDVKREQLVASHDLEASFTFGAFASWSLDRRRQLEQALIAAQDEVRQAMDLVAEAYQDLKKLEIAQEMRRKRELAERERKEQMRLDDMALVGYRRKQEQAG